MELNKINSSGTTWGAEASALNENFGKIDSSIEQLKNSTTRNKGYFSSEAALKSAVPTAAKGDKAYVGGAYPYQIWTWNGSAWVNSGSTGGEESVRLGDYYTKETTDAKFEETDAKLSELGSKVLLTPTDFSIKNSIWTEKNLKHIVIPISGGASVEIKSSLYGYYTVLSEYKKPSEGESPIFAEGYTDRIYFEKNKQFTAPSNARYLYLFYSESENYKIESVKVDGVERYKPLDDVVAEITHKSMAGINDAKEAIPLFDIESDNDLELSDINGNVIALFSDGNIKTKKFDSSRTDLKEELTEDDFVVADEKGNAVVSFEKGHIRTKNFDSRNAVIPEEDKTEEVDLAVLDEQNNAIVSFEEGHIRTKNFDSRNIKSEKRIKILVIGNSYSAQAFGYAPPIIEESCANANIEVMILYIGSGRLEQHYNNFHNNGGYEMFYYSSENGKWSDGVSYNIKRALDFTKWDILLFHQQSSRSRDYSTYQPYLNNLIDDINNYIGYNIKCGLVINPSYPTIYTEGLNDVELGYSDTMDSMFDKICNAAQSVLDNTLLDFIVPCGTAIQNARTTALKELGTSGDLFSDPLHLQEGLPILLESYVSALSVLSFISPKNSIIGSKIRPNAEWAEKINKPQRTHGDNIGITDENCLLAQKCAIMAIKNPSVQTDMRVFNV